MTFKRILVFLWMALFFFAMSQTAMGQCAMCKSNLEMARTGEGTQVGNTINQGIMYLLVLPYAIAGIFGYIFYRKHKEKKKALASQSSL